MNEHRYILEPGSRKHHCPECSKKTFVCYIDRDTGEYLPEQYGRCDRESKCTYHLNPYKDGYAKAIREQEQGNRSKLPSNWKPQRKKVKPQPEPVFIPVEVFKQTLQPDRYEQNTFLQNLLHRVQYPFEATDVEKVVSLYYLGTVAKGYRTGAITFPFIDKAGNVRTVQVKQFDQTNHTTGTDFLHSIIDKLHTRNNKPLPGWLEGYTKQDKFVSCLFGEHLLSKYPLNPVALVEAPKTAVYGTLYFGLPESPENLIWLAVYNKSSFTLDKLKILQGRDVFTFPDLSKDGNTFKEWQAKAKELENRLPRTRFVFSDLLEQLAPERDKSEGNDLADYLIKQDWRLFRKRSTPEPLHRSKGFEPIPQAKPIQEQAEPTEPEIAQQGQPEAVEVSNAATPDIHKEPGTTWDVKALETFFANVTLPDEPIQLKPAEKITDIHKFISSHLNRVKANKNNSYFLPDLKRLQLLKSILAKAA